MPTRAALVLLASLLAAAPAAAQTAPAAPKPEKPKAAAEAPPEPIDGQEFARPNGGFLGIKLQSVQLKVTFYDKKKEKVAADAVRIAAR